MRLLDVLFVTASGSGVAGLCVEVVRRRPDNHVGFSPWVLLIIPSAVLAIEVCRSAIARRIGWTSANVAASWVLTLAALVAADHWNVLVSYESWIKRGMPAPWDSHPSR